MTFGVGSIVVATLALAVGLALGALARHATERRARETFAAHWREELRAAGEGRDRALADKHELEDRLERERETSDDASAGLRRLRKERDAARERARAVDEERREIEIRLREADGARELAARECAELATRLESREAAIESSTLDGQETARRAAALGDEAALLREELERAKALHEGCDTRIEELSRQRVAAEREMRELRAAADRARDVDIEKRGTAERTHSRDRKAWREREAALESELGETRATAAELRSETERLGRRLSERAAAAATLETAVAVADERSATADGDAARARAELARLRELVDDRTLALASAPPAWIRDSPRGEADELSAIRGVGEVIESRLHELGVFHFDQLAAMSDADRRWLSAHLGVPDSRIARERWREQARLQLPDGEPESDGDDAGETPERRASDRQSRGRQST